MDLIEKFESLYIKINCSLILLSSYVAFIEANNITQSVDNVQLLFIRVLLNTR